MKKFYLAALATLLTGSMLIGCGGGGSDRHPHHPDITTVQILSDQGYDGDIAFTPPSTYVISSAAAAHNVLAGVDPSTGDEYRCFLDFALGGSGGVPLDATIVSATLEIQINSVTVAADGDTVPMILDLVSFQPPSPISTDYDRTSQPALLSESFVFYTSDAGTLVDIDVTPLMQEVQRDGLADLQVRLLLDLSTASGLIEIDDNASVTAPLLTVQYE